ncbi:hypothetical protein A2291_06685 [candidate division WOR-1 bacterium RIFOXYB2_FULL_42_35]|uniref:Addiction module toxin, HicA family n=1 Tax=candidate division WOR-1 bacterium RIFOXYC2_FULL_41_25 TaxID=1802586 RepID=A0A1F4TPG7_UNCSA|nr:MAG: hypothetical protein A2291_06685 [candidate division WOR-1 bacterium RIFOXYB2_FULL_42_35]OGC24567.1 MAG: hypothetical protein A2247_06465 [candidate division WOR-1 bacterium RIFOXYA2_FULL_41_14]OGC34612.1 MAG: hypothetical protein A2462_04700 [candidate division WOR-1 bacterium RIFOXYC2_FULL_41_25]OGC43980.1 MAG: hypothetical protein A2548_06260 [candidate division WOR-1 bacterium RIFOXYD2_FULL_41_8]
MPKIPRDISGRELIKLLNKKYGYQAERETGSHIRLKSLYKGIEHKITIPDHDEIKIGTLNNILKDISAYLEISKEALVLELF